MNYQEFLDYIYQRHSGNVKLGLDRIKNILAEMGNPNLQLKGIHVAGTNGKGSTSAMCEAMALAHNLSTGLNTSPHLVDYRERIRVSGQEISFAELLEIYQQWGDMFEQNEASFFEITTALAFYHFQQRKVDLAIMEVGLGGRLDGTNPFKSTVSVINTISIDHPKSLGDTVEKIAYEKAGIIKANTPVVVGKIAEPALSVIRAVATAKKAEIIQLGQDFSIENIHLDEAGTTFDYISEDLSLQQITINLLGEHQAYNCAVAITAFRLFMQKTQQELSAEKLRQGLSQINWQGRMQILQQKPTVIIDGAHNEEGIDALVKNIASIFPDKKIHFVLAILRDKNLKSIIEKICQLSYKLYISKNQSTRAAEIEEQAILAKSFGCQPILIPDVLEATKLALKNAQADELVFISGSLYTISEILAAQKQLFHS
ncbi:MAG: folylpolyglutamate synthase/dihydrofolate synthase family protein [Candidatus Cloacimonadales bacterium]